MKKLFIVLAVASLGFVACNNESETKTEGDTTTVVTPDTTKIITPDTTKIVTPDTTKTADTSAKK